MEKNILCLFEKNHGILSMQMLKAQNVKDYNIRKMLKQGEIVKIKKGVYKLNNYDDQNELIEVNQIVPKGVICLLSAALVHELTTFVPAQYEIAIPHKHKIILPDYPPIKFFYWQEKSYLLGQEKLNIDDGMINIYDREKTVCDVLKYRQKIGMEYCKEVINNYLASPQRNIVKLRAYGKQVRVSSILDIFLEILL